VAAGFPPTPAQAVLKLGKAQENFYTLARTLAARGYATDFIYGGEGHFDNMAGFFLRNGFQRFIDQHDYERPVFRGSWGVSDEDLFERAHQEFLAHGDKPFFALVFSSSFHSPFEFPDGRIELYEEPKGTPHNAVKYADYALGAFFRKARQAPYWDNTLFLVVADHDARVFGASLVPIERVHVPGLILGKSIAPRRHAKPASQIDLAPTLLSLMGIESEHPMIGHDLTRLPAEFPGRAVMQYENNHAYLRGAQVVIHEPHKPPRHFRNEGGRLQPAEAPDRELEREALAHALWPSLAYRQMSYRLGSRPAENETPRAARAVGALR
jgi:phosphoglycerol transferase MdoB-like AlkP superfamily enzyme